MSKKNINKKAGPGQPKKPFTKKVALFVRVDPDVKKRLDKFGRGKGKVVRAAIDKFLRIKK